MNETVTMTELDDPSVELELRFTHHPPQDDEQVEKYEEIRSYAKGFATALRELCPMSRELKLAVTNLEQSVFWANAAIARRS
jgi:hypothetical protein